MARTTEERIVQTTLFIEAFGPGTGSSGTCFQFAAMTSSDTAIQLLITNKHIVEDATSLKIHFSTSDPSDHEIKTGNAVCHITGNWDSLWTPHPDPEVDLGAIYLTPILKKLQEMHGKYAYGIAFSDNDLLDEETLKNLSPIEDVFMIGYPIGLRDPINNQPIVRKGTTATDIRQSFRGKEEFLIDCACWPGSSGSPILIKTSNIRTNGPSMSIKTSRSFLAGVLYAGPAYSSSGKIEFKPIPTSNAATITTSQMIHLGNVINARRIRELIELAKTPTKEISNIHKTFDFTKI